MGIKMKKERILLMGIKMKMERIILMRIIMKMKMEMIIIHKEKVDLLIV